MVKHLPKELLDKGQIRQEQYDKIELITSGKLVSVFYELRTLLYLGVMLFTTGVGILIYQNIGDIGHLVCLAILTLITVGCFFYIFKNAPTYNDAFVKSSIPYLDYVVLLGALLFVSIFAYLQFLYNIVEDNPGLIALLTSVFFFYIAYRFDHLGVLSLGITAFASFFSINVSFQRWYSGDLPFKGLHNTAIIFSTVVTLIALLLDRKGIKKHFTFTYLNFCCLIFFVGAIAGMFEESSWYGLYLLLTYGGCVFTYYMARWKKSFLFLLYAFLAAYVGTTYMLVDIFMQEFAELWFLYSMASCGGFVYFIIKYKNHFKQQA